MRHLLLTGEIQVGKSTAINRALEHCMLQRKIKIGGFKTIWKKDFAYVHLVNADGSEECSDENIAFSRGIVDGQRQFIVHNDVFDGHGVELLSQKGKDLILMDEIGTAEKDCRLFHDKLVETLDGVVPVLGVIQIRQGGFLDEIRNHPDVELIFVTEENREDARAYISRWIEINVLKKEKITISRIVRQ